MTNRKWLRLCGRPVTAIPFSQVAALTYGRKGVDHENILAVALTIKEIQYQILILLHVVWEGVLFII